MLKKVGTVAAVATAALLALSPLAFAGGVDVVDQEIEQESAQGNGILNGNNLISGNAVQLCGVNIAALNGVLVQVPVGSVDEASGSSATAQGAGACSNAGTAVGQSTTQGAWNDND
ncbi:hypothetical protein [Pseudonocardia sp.]|uniref:hypothetical protein n=1 Tax=Pseudonocardia sp. TaxID=60912 RepID=UPI003D11A7CB